MARAYEGGGWADEDNWSETPGTIGTLRTKMWSQGNWHKDFVICRKASCGAWQLFKDVYARRYYSDTALHVLEHITPEEYAVRKLTGTLETIPDECIKHGFKNGYFK